MQPRTCDYESGSVIRYLLELSVPDYGLLDVEMEQIARAAFRRIPRSAKIRESFFALLPVAGGFAVCYFLIVPAFSAGAARAIADLISYGVLTLLAAVWILHRARVVRRRYAPYVWQEVGALGIDICQTCGADLRETAMDAHRCSS